MTLNTARRVSYLVSRTLGDLQAVRRGRIGERIFNRIVGRIVSGLMRSVWR